MKENIKLDFIKIQNFCFVKVTVIMKKNHDNVFVKYIIMKSCSCSIYYILPAFTLCPDKKVLSSKTR